MKNLLGSYKNIFAVDIDGEEEYGECRHFIIRKAEAELLQKQEQAFENLEGYEKKASLPKYLSIIKSVCFFIFIVVFVGTIRALPDVGTAAFTNAPWLTAIGIVSGITVLVLHSVEKKRDKGVLESEQFKEDAERADSIGRESREALGIPSDAKDTDMFFYPFKMKNGMIKQAGSMFDFMNTELKVFREDDTLCIADSACVIGIPIRDIEKIVKVERRISFIGWNKETAFNKGEFKEHKISSNQYGIMFLKSYYALRFHGAGDDYEVLFPAYELETFERITGIHAENIQ